jgi:hypothetical protein
MNVLYQQYIEALQAYTNHMNNEQAREQWKKASQAYLTALGATRSLPDPPSIRKIGGSLKNTCS